MLMTMATMMMMAMIIWGHWGTVELDDDKMIAVMMIAMVMMAMMMTMMTMIIWGHWGTVEWDDGNFRWKPRGLLSLCHSQHFHQKPLYFSYSKSVFLKYFKSYFFSFCKLYLSDSNNTFLESCNIYF